MWQHGHMSVATDIWPSLRTFGRISDQTFVYNTEIQFYGYMSVNNAFITQATGLYFCLSDILNFFDFFDFFQFI
jgi:hypothetical protein